MLPFELCAFADGVEKLIVDDALLRSLRQGARAAGARYTLENMVGNVATGISRCLGIGPVRQPD
jgi:hypothetical protein